MITKGIADLLGGLGLRVLTGCVCLHVLQEMISFENGHESALLQFKHIVMSL